MTKKEAKQLIPGKSYVRFAEHDYMVAEVKIFPGNALMVGIFDEPPSLHIDFINIDNVEPTPSVEKSEGEEAETVAINKSYPNFDRLSSKGEADHPIKPHSVEAADTWLAKKNDLQQYTIADTRQQFYIRADKVIELLAEYSSLLHSSKK